MVFSTVNGKKHDVHEKYQYVSDVWTDLLW
jgi:hypothetical protein